MNWMFAEIAYKRATKEFYADTLLAKDFGEFVIRFTRMQKAEWDYIIGKSEIKQFTKSPFDLLVIPVMPLKQPKSLTSF